MRLRATALAVYSLMLLCALILLLGSGMWEAWVGAGIVMLIVGFCGSEVLHRWPT